MAKKYFVDIFNDCFCYTKESIIDMMKIEGIKEVKAYEAVREINNDFFWCNEYGKVGETYRIIKISNESLYFNEDSAIDISRVKVRPATEDEIKEFNRYKYKDGEGVWVKNNFDNPWDFRYTTGKIVDNRIECYHYQKKEGSSRSYWSIYQPAPGVEPPVSVTD